MRLSTDMCSVIICIMVDTDLGRSTEDVFYVVIMVCV